MQSTYLCICSAIWESILFPRTPPSPPPLHPSGSPGPRGVPLYSSGIRKRHVVQDHDSESTRVPLPPTDPRTDISSPISTLHPVLSSFLQKHFIPHDQASKVILICSTTLQLLYLPLYGSYAIDTSHITRLH